MKKTLLLILALSLSSCSLLGNFSSLDPKNLIKTAGTTAVAYAVAGPIPAIANLATSIVIDEVLPEDGPQIKQIETREQMTAFIIANITNAILYGVMGFLAFILIIAPWAADRRAKRKMKDAYRKKKYDKMKAELNIRRDKQ
jgi:alpha-glucuronidase